jgi:integrase
LPLAKARQKAILGDPEAQKEPTVLALIQEFERIHLPKCSISVQKHWTYILNDIIKPLHNKPYNTLQPRDILKIVETLKPVIGNHTVVAFNRLSSWSHQTGRIHVPLSLKRPNKEKPRDRVLTLPEIKKIYHAAQSMDTFGTIIQVCLFTACRRGETQNYTLQQTSVTFLDTKNDTDHTLPITPQLHSLLQRDLKWNSWSKYKRLLDNRSTITNWTIHDIRRSVATHMAEQLDIRSEVIEAILNHKVRGVAGTYNRSKYLLQMTNALARWEQLVLSL